jgi:hypothetical protein
LAGELSLVESGIAPGDVVVHGVGHAEVADAAGKVAADSFDEVAAVDGLSWQRARRSPPSVRSGVAVRPRVWMALYLPISTKNYDSVRTTWPCRGLSWSWSCPRKSTPGSSKTRSGSRYGGAGTGAPCEGNRASRTFVLRNPHAVELEPDTEAQDVLF